MDEHNVSELSPVIGSQQQITPEKPSKIKKIIIISLTVFILFLIFTYFLIGPKVLFILQGQLESTETQDFKTEYKNWTIEFTPAVFLELQQYYLSIQKTEFSVCLLGNYHPNNTNQVKLSNYFVTSLYYPKTFEKAFDHVIFQECPAETIIALHSHPYKDCLFSEQDISTYHQSVKYNQNLLFAIMCEKNRFTFYRE